MLIRDSRDINALDWDKMDGLLPAIVQDAFDGRVLMQAYMNPEALAHSLDNGLVTFWSRSRQQLWTTDTCFDSRLQVRPELAFLAALERLVAERDCSRPEDSYTTRLFEAGVKRIAQKVGEEGLETALAAVAGDTDELTEEAADLVYHLLVLLRAAGLSLGEVVSVLESRHSPS
jgi:phosphoribosyl-ATP pyrophosphohydrolase/phosphoribosyl-AMP cyclohydrolase